MVIHDRVSTYPLFQLAVLITPVARYNRINGTHVSENKYILDDILRKEWGFEGMTMSDWFGIYSIDLSINAGLDLEMPGTNKWRSLDLVNRSIGSRKLLLRTIKERAANVLELVQKCAKHSPEVCLDRHLYEIPGLKLDCTTGVGR